MWGWTHTYDCESEPDCASETPHGRERDSVCVCARERERQLKQMKIANFDVWRLFHARPHSDVGVDVDVSTDNGTHMIMKGVGGGSQRTQSSLAQLSLPSLLPALPLPLPLSIVPSGSLALTRTTLATGVSS